jgi:hypothetical protein
VIHDDDGDGDESDDFMSILIAGTYGQDRHADRLTYISRQPGVGYVPNQLENEIILCVQV